MSDFSESLGNHSTALELTSLSAIPRLGYHKSHDGTEMSEEEDNAVLTSLGSSNSTMSSSNMPLELDAGECRKILPEEDMGEGSAHKPGYFYAKYYSTLSVCLVLYVLCLRGMLYTSSYFHTMAESVAALVQCVLLLMLPLYALSHYNSYCFYYYVLGINSSKI